ncbi:MAG: TonB family protein [Pseudomonadales bacterium]
MDSATTANHIEPRTLLESFGIASLVVLLGVGGSWIALKTGTPEASLELPPLPKFAWAQSAVATSSADIPLLEKAEAAFAAGRVSAPEGNNAFHFYRLAVEAEPDNAEALAGLERSMSYMLGNAESAVFRNDWATAEALARQILAAQADNADAGGLLTRTLRFQKIEQLTSLAASYLTASQLDSPKNENAVSVYRRILRLEGENPTALQGLDSIAQRFLASAQTAAFAGNLKDARDFIARAEAVNPEYSGLKKTRQMVADWKKVNQNQALQSKLIAAATALQEDRLVSASSENALALYDEVLAVDPQSEAAKRGRQLVADALVDRAWTLAQAGDRAAAEQMLAEAKIAGADGNRVAELEKEFAYQQTLADAREGNIDRLVSVSELNTLRRVSPDYPRGASEAGLEGWVELRFTISIEGDVVDAKVAKSSSDVFHRNALAAIKRWRFDPYQDAGRPVPVRSGIRFSFKP